MIARIRYILIPVCAAALFAVSVAGELKIYGVTASSVEFGNREFRPENSSDADKNTRWASERSDSQWICFDLWEKRTFNFLTIKWETAYARSFEIQVSNNAKKWKTVFSEVDGAGGTEAIVLKRQKARYIRILCRKRATEWGYSIYEFKAEDLGRGELKKRISKADISDVSASTPADNTQTFKAVDGDMLTRWSSEATDTEWIKFTLRRKTVIDRVVIHWEAAYGETYQLQVSLDGKEWRLAYNAVKHRGGKDILEFKPVEVKYVRIYGISRGTQWGYSIFECEIFRSEKKPVSLTELSLPGEIEYRKEDISPAAYCYRKAAEMPPGYFPEWFYGKQSYWTVSGVPGGEEETLLSESGMIDVKGGDFSLMPYLYFEGGLLSAATSGDTVQKLEKGYIPEPSVTWKSGAYEVIEKIYSFTKGINSFTCISLCIKNTESFGVEGRLFLTIRPFQVTPPWMRGGFSEIKEIEKKGNVIYVNGYPAIFALKEPDGFGVSDYKSGDIIEFAGAGILPGRQQAADPSGFVSAAMQYDFALSPNGETEYLFLVPLDGRQAFDTSRNTGQILDLKD